MVLALPLLLLCGVAAAAEPEPEAEPPPEPLASEKEARERYLRAQRFFNEERYADSAAELQAAYQQDPKPIFLFNLGQSLRRANRLVEARDAFRRFLQEDPKDQLQLQRQTRVSIRELDLLIVQLQEKRRPLWRKPWFWIATAGAAVALAVGLGVGIGVGRGGSAVPATDGGVVMLRF